MGDAVPEKTTGSPGAARRVRLHMQGGSDRVVRLMGDEKWGSFSKLLSKELGRELRFLVDGGGIDVDGLVKDISPEYGDSLVINVYHGQIGGGDEDSDEDGAGGRATGATTEGGQEATEGLDAGGDANANADGAKGGSVGGDEGRKSATEESGSQRGQKKRKAGLLSRDDDEASSSDSEGIDAEDDEDEAPGEDDDDVELGDDQIGGIPNALTAGADAHNRQKGPMACCPKCKHDFEVVHSDDIGPETTIPGFEYITAEMIKSPAFRKMKMGFYLSRQAGGHGKWELVLGISYGDTAELYSGLSARVITNQRAYGHIGKWIFFADGQLDGEERQWGSSATHRKYKLRAFEAMVKHSLRGWSSASTENEVTSTEMFQYDSMRQADDAAKQIIGWIKKLIEEGTLTIPANSKDPSAGEGNITIDPKESKGRLPTGRPRSHFTFDNDVGEATHAKLNLKWSLYAQAVQLREEFEVLVKDLEDKLGRARATSENSHYSNIIAFIGRHGKRKAVVEKWLKKNIEPEEKWAALDEEDRKGFESVKVYGVGLCRERGPEAAYEQNKAAWQKTLENHHKCLDQWQSSWGWTRPGKEINHLLTNDEQKLAKYIEMDIFRFRSSDRGANVSDFLERKYAAYRDRFHLVEFSETGDEIQSSVLSEEAWLTKRGITSHKDKLKWAKELNPKNIWWGAKGKCLCGTAPKAEDIQCVNKLCVKCCKWHLVHTNHDDGPAPPGGWECGVCSPRAFGNGSGSTKRKRKREKYEEVRANTEANMEKERKRLKKERAKEKKATKEQANSRAARANERLSRFGE